MCCRVRLYERAPLRCFAVAGNMDMLLQSVEESEDVGDVERTVATGSAKKMKSTQNTCTVREIILLGQQSVQKEVRK